MKVGLGSRCGSIMPMFGLGIFVLLGISGLAIDYSRAMNARSQLSAAADSAILAALTTAEELKNDPSLTSQNIIEKSQAAARNYMQANAKTRLQATLDRLDITVKQVNEGWTAEIAYTARLPGTITSTMGVEAFQIAGAAKSSVASALRVLDIAMCVDSTGSMQPSLDAVKANALSFYDNINAEMKKRGLPAFPQVRVRVLFFKDYGDINPGVWDPDPMRASNFFSLPAEKTQFSDFVAPQVAYGGWDWPESDQECLSLALSSPWTKVGDPIPGQTGTITDVFPLIVLWSDSSAHPIPFPNSLANPNYPPENLMPRTNAGLLDKWNNPAVIDQKNKQVLYFGDPYQPGENGYENGYDKLMAWPKFVHAGQVTDADVSLIKFLADGIELTARGIAITN